MNNSMNSRKNAARQEKQQQRLDAGFMSEHFPEVGSVVIRMMYTQKGIQKSLPRTVIFYPSSYALFKINCLSWSCVDGGFDLTRIINSMIRNHLETAKGELSCEGGSSAGHSSIVYEVAIQYV